MNSAEQQKNADPRLSMSVVIPARNEAESIGQTVGEIHEVLDRAGIEHEVLVVDDHSTDATAARVTELAEQDARTRLIVSPYTAGFGLTVRAGLEQFSCDSVAIMMADGSDDPADLVTYQRLLASGYDCAFGSRFIRGSHVHDYPRLKLTINRIVNLGIRMLFRHHYNDTTNAFKAYRREVIDAVQPLLSNHFNLTVEIPLKAIARGFTFGIAPISWRNRRYGRSKLSLQEMGSRYLFIVLYVFLERHLSRGDYRRLSSPDDSGANPEKKPGAFAAR